MSDVAFWSIRTWQPWLPPQFLGYCNIPVRVDSESEL